MNYNHSSNNIVTGKITIKKEMTKDIIGKKITNYFYTFMVRYMFMFKNRFKYHFGPQPLAFVSN